MKNAIDYNLKNIYLTTFKNKSDRFYNIIWDNYYQSQNCRSINTYINLDYKNYKILGACNPTLAHEALENESLIGILMPCNVLIIDNEDQTTKVVFPVAESLLEVTGNDIIFDLAKKVDDLLKSAFDEVN